MWRYSEKDQVVSFEVAKLAEKIKFNWNCYMKYNIVDVEYVYRWAPGVDRTATMKAGTLIEANEQQSFHNWNDEYCVAPTQYMLNRYLIEIHNMYVSVRYRGLNDWGFDVLKLDNTTVFVKLVVCGELVYTSHTEAFEEGLKAALIYIVNNNKKD